MQAQPDKIPGPPASLVVVGAALTLASAFLSWFEIETGNPELDNAYSGLDLLKSLGAGLFGLGAVLLALGAIQWARESQGRGRGVAIAALIVSIMVIVTGAIALMQPVNSLGRLGESEVSEDYGIDEEVDAAEELAAAEETGFIRVKSGPGALLALGGGSLGLLGSTLGLLRIIRRAALRPEEEPPLQKRDIEDVSD